LILSDYLEKNLLFVAFVVHLVESLGTTNLSDLLALIQNARQLLWPSLLPLDINLPKDLTSSTGAGEIPNSP
jgi:hypothetical protein